MRRAVRNRPRRPWACLRLARTALAAHWSEPVLLPRSYSIDANKHPSSKTPDHLTLGTVQLSLLSEG
jgi:hypothetical protein